MLSATDFLHRVVIADFVVHAVEVGDVEAQALTDSGVRVGAVLAVGDGLVAVEERGALSREGQHGVVGVVNRAADVEVDEVDVPVVFIAAFGGQRGVDDAGVVVEADIEAVLEKLWVEDGNHHLFEGLAVIFFHESLKRLSRCPPNMVPGGVGHSDEHRVAGHGDVVF